MRTALVLVMALIGSLLPPMTAAPEALTTVYVVRHAEKAATPGERDPELSEAGQARAAALARTLRSAGVEACFASQFRRTQATLQPLAKAAGLEVTVVQAGTEKALGAKILADWKGKTLAVAGHSNTVPAILKALGAEAIADLGENDYDDLFVLRIDEKGGVRVLHLHYGAANPH